MGSIYGDQRPALTALMERLTGEIVTLRERLTAQYGSDPVEHCLARIKDEESMREKCRRRGLPETEESALEQIHDALGFRVVCAFLRDVYAVRDFVVGLPGAELVEEKDYIRHVKPNGYRSLHLIQRKGLHTQRQAQWIPQLSHDCTGRRRSQRGDSAPDHLHGHLGRAGAPYEI